MCHAAFSVIPSPHVFPNLLTRRNSFPLSIAAATSQSFNSFRTQSGTGTGSDVASFADQIHNCLMFLAQLNVIPC
jgi:hypothetical protein